MAFDPTPIINELEHNKAVFSSLLATVPEAQYRWRPAPEKWNLLEVVGHLHDEEREDFRTRVKCVLEDPTQPLPPIDPVAWVTDRDYNGQQYAIVMANLMRERDHSIAWLRSLHNPNWNNTFQHAHFGPMTAKLFLCNWLAHDHLHIRQIMRLKHQWLQAQTNENLLYAGEW